MGDICINGIIDRNNKVFEYILIRIYKKRIKIIS